MALARVSAKLFINTDDARAGEVEARLQLSGIEFESYPTSGPVTFWHSDYVAYGASEILHVIAAVCPADSTNRAAVPSRDPRV